MSQTRHIQPENLPPSEQQAALLHAPELSAEHGLDPAWLKAQLFDKTPLGLCVMQLGAPLLINWCFAHMLGGCAEDTHATADVLTARWPALWPQLQHIGRETRSVQAMRVDGTMFVGRAYRQSLHSLHTDAELIMLIDDSYKRGIAFYDNWRARMLEQAEAMGRSGSAEIDLASGSTVMSKGLHDLLGMAFNSKSVPRKLLLRQVPVADRSSVISVWQNAATDTPFHIKHRLVHQDGTVLEVLQRGTIEIDAAGQRHGYFTLQDITAQRQAEQRIQQLTYRDEVTGLGNRSHLLACIATAMQSSQGGTTSFLLVSVQVDRVAQLKQAMGYSASDAMARAVALRLSTLTSADDVVARLDGGEFAILISPRSSLLDTTGFVHARSVMETLSRPELLGNADVVPGARVGVARFPQDAHTAVELLEAAQMARLGIERNGEQIALFTAENRALALRRLAIESGLRRAAERGELSLSYQLQAELATGDPIGVQAMLEWNSPELGSVPSEEFFPVALQSDVIVALGDWKRNALCMQLQEWISQGVRVPRMSTRISSLELQQHDIVEKVRESITQYGIEPHHLGIEITERVLLDSNSELANTLLQLKALGMEITLGDFGGNFTNLGILRHLPIDVIKIDRTCLPDVSAPKSAVSLTRAIINMGHSLQVQVQAEGVETTGQLTLLIANGCDRVQGPVLSPRVDGPGLLRVLAEYSRLPDNLLSYQRQRTLLLVDDEPNIVNALKRLFRRDGYRIITAHSGAEGLERMSEFEVDVVLSDQRMPGMTGVAFLRSAKELYPDTVRMVLSGYTELQSITDAINEGAIYRFLTKPWDDEQLRQHVKEAFRSRELASENKRLATDVVAANEALAHANDRLERVLGLQQVQLSHEAARAEASRDLIDHLPLPVLGIAPDGMVVMVNLQAQAVWGPDTALLGQSAGHLLRQRSPSAQSTDLLEPAANVVYDDTEEANAAWQALLKVLLHDTPHPSPHSIELQGKHWQLLGSAVNGDLARGMLIALVQTTASVTPTTPVDSSGLCGHSPRTL